ncbi:MAG: PLP-dependent aminotransferase family protein [Acidobacteriota bacterium]
MNDFGKRELNQVGISNEFSSRHDFHIADWLRNAERHTMQQMLSMDGSPDIISFALGLPAPDSFPNQAYAEAVSHLLARDRVAFQLTPPFQPLKRHIVEMMKERGIDCTEEQVFLISGAQQGLDLVARMFLNQGTQVILEEASYTGFHKAIEPFQPEILTVPVDPQTGIDLDAVETLLLDGARPAFIYTMSDGHNPLGISMPRENRVRLVELARQYHIPIIEDDAYGFIYYQETPNPPLRALEDKWVLYIGSFSKILGPSLRTGWMIVPSELTSKLAVIKSLIDIDCATFTQRAISAFIDLGYLKSQLTYVRQDYCERCDIMIEALKKYFPPQARWHKPNSGVFIWVELPEQVDTMKLLKAAVEQEKVAFVPGSAFSINAQACLSNSLRLNFTNCRRDKIEDGIARLAKVVKTMIK